MSDYPSDLKYTQTHEWVRVEEDNTAVIGITDHAQCQLGDLVFVELPKLNDELSAGDEAGVVESVKTASDFYTPLSGEVIEINEALLTSPQLINEDPYGRGWLFKIQLDDTDELEDLLDADDYQETIED